METPTNTLCKTRMLWWGGFGNYGPDYAARRICVLPVGAEEALFGPKTAADIEIPEALLLQLI